MPIYKNYSGNYVNLADIAFPAAYQQNQPEEFKEQLLKDKMRTNFIVWKQSLAEARNIVFDPDTYEKRYSYMQGDVEGRSLLLMLTNRIFPDLILGGGTIDSIAFAYFDKNNTPCGLAISKITDNKGENNALRYRYAALLIRNTTASPQEREVFFSCENSLLQEIEPTFNERRQLQETSTTQAIIIPQIQSTQIMDLMAPLFNGDSTAFDNLKARTTFSNLDNRDIRKKQFEKWLQIVDPLKQDATINADVKKQIQLSQDDFNFYENEKFKKILSKDFGDKSIQEKVKALLLEYRIYNEQNIPTPNELAELSQEEQDLHAQKDRDTLLNSIWQEIAVCKDPYWVAVITESLKKMPAWESLAPRGKKAQINLLNELKHSITSSDQSKDESFIKAHEENNYALPSSYHKTFIDEVLAIKPPTTHTIDLQERMIYDVRDKNGRIITVNRETTPALITAYRERVSSQLETYKVEKAQITNIFTLLDKLPNKKSIKPLQQELYLFLSDLAHQESNRHNFDKKIWAQILVSTRTTVADLVDQAFAKALIHATNDIKDWATANLDIAKLNGILEIEKKSIIIKAHNTLLSTINNTHPNNEKGYVLPRPVFLYADNNTQFTWVDTKKTRSFTHQSIQTHPQQGLHIILPSLKVDGSILHSEIAEHVKDVIHSYKIKTPFSYHVFAEREAKTERGLQEIILALHTVNRDANTANSRNPPYCLLQAYGSGRPLAYRRSFFWSGADVALDNELALMAEMSLLQQVNMKNYTENYESFLNPKPLKGFSRFLQVLQERIYGKPLFFSQSTAGLAAQQKIATLKKSWQKSEPNPRCYSNPQTMIKQALKKIMAFDLHCNHGYAGLIEALSLALAEPAAYSDHSKQQLAGQVFEQVQALRQNLPTLLEHLTSLAEVDNQKAAQKATKNLAQLLTELTENTHDAVANLLPRIDEHATQTSKTLQPDTSTYPQTSKEKPYTPIISSQGQPPAKQQSGNKNKPAQEQGPRHY